MIYDQESQHSEPERAIRMTDPGTLPALKLRNSLLELGDNLLLLHLPFYLLRRLTLELAPRLALHLGLLLLLDLLDHGLGSNRLDRLVLHLLL